jgi:hypothetical protein
MAIGHEQMEVERAALAPGVQEYGWIGAPSRVGGWAQAGGGGSFRLLPTRVSTGEHHYINWVGEDSAEPSDVSIWDSTDRRVNFLVACVPGPDSVF